MQSWLTDLRREIATVVLGKSGPIDLLLIGLLAPGHVLLEDVPGVGKTMLARTVARCLDLEFRRVQFTPDLLPSDISGTSVLDLKTNEPHFREGPLFTQVLLADEINRATPRTQSALLEAMEEGQVSESGVTYSLKQPFFVLATQNPVELQGTYPLPEAQLDRFLLRVELGYPDHDAEVALLSLHHHGQALQQVKTVAGPDDVLAARAEVSTVHVSEAVRGYIVDLAEATRRHEHLALGASPRGSLALHRAAQARAYIDGRDFVRPDDVQVLVGSVFGHRLILAPQQALRGVRVQDALHDVLETVPAPREAP